MQAVLVMFRSDGERRSFSVTRDVTVIGRREDCDLRIPLNDVSRKHARLVKEDGGIRLEDLGSSNGTFLNGERIERDAVLQAGDSVQVGPVVFVLQVDGYPGDDELNPVTAESAAAGGAYAAAGAVGGAAAGAAAGGYGEEELEPLPLGDDPTGDFGTPDQLAAGQDHGGAMEASAEDAEGLVPLGEDELEPLPAEDGLVPLGEEELEPLNEEAAAPADELQPLAGEDELAPIPLDEDDGAIPLSGGGPNGAGPAHADDGLIPLADDDLIPLADGPSGAHGHADAIPLSDDDGLIELAD
ncbi:MAG TPA: FHA domain-containing protein, partial [Humisphaera sp.]